MKKAVIFLTLVMTCVFLAGCNGKGNDGRKTAQTSGKSESSTESEDANTGTVTAQGDYGIGTAFLGNEATDEWEAIQDAPGYSDGKVMATIDSDNKLRQMRAYFNEADMVKDYVLFYEGEKYSSIEEIIEKFGDFNSIGIIKYDNGKVKLHVEVTNKEKGEYYISLKEYEMEN